MTMEGVPLFSLLCLRRRVFNKDNFGLRQLYPVLYKCIQTEGAPSFDGDRYPYGSVFNIDFSPSDKLALTVCSNMSIAGYDPRVQVTKAACAVTQAHNDCVNCITFINDFLFATCSDDMTIRLWDMRNFGPSLQTLTGHSNWIKNIEYDRNSNKLFSVAFFDGVREWEMGALHQYLHDKHPSNLVIEAKDPVRMRIAPDGSKMFISMRKNVCCIIDQFDGSTLADSNPLVEKLLHSQEEDLRMLRSNRPSIHTMSELQETEQSFRAVMSVEFHPSSDMIALRYIDITQQRFSRERSTLYDLRMSDEDYRPFCSNVGTSPRYLKCVDEHSLSDLDDTMDFIKEFCFSRDGLVLASPHLRGVRLLAMDNSCTPMEIYNDDRFHNGDKPRDCQTHGFEVVNTISGDYITSPVLSCRFARHDYVLATGGYSGQFLFHKPRL